MSDTTNMYETTDEDRKAHDIINPKNLDLGRSQVKTDEFFDGNGVHIIVINFLSDPTEVTRIIHKFLQEDYRVTHIHFQKNAVEFEKSDIKP